MFSEGFAWLLGLTILPWLALFLAGCLHRVRVYGQRVYHHPWYKLQDPWLEMSEAERDMNYQQELVDLTHDLEEHLKVVQLPSTSQSGANQQKVPKFDALRDLGLAENERLTISDDTNEHPGDSWQTSGRPLIFAALQLALGVPLLLLLGLLPILPFFTALWSWAVATLFLGLLCYVFVPEKKRLAVRRFAKQIDFLGSGLQFIIPLIEEYDVIDLGKYVWGPHANKPAQVEYLEGSLGTKANPSPGVFLVYLLGKWPFTINFSVTLGTRRSSPTAWYYSTYEYTNPNEVGERLAQVIEGVLFNKIRELKPTGVQNVNPTQAGQAAVTTQVQTLLDFLNEVPEICANVLLTIHRLGRQSMAGLIVESVALTSILPDPRFERMIQETDQAKIDGEAAVERWREQVGYLHQVPDSMRQLFIRMEELRTQGLFASQSTGALEALLKALSLMATQSSNRTTTTSTGP